jgi:hypothetical protein
MADSTAMTVDFLRARLLSERSVSRASKERADELTKKVRAPRAMPRRAKWLSACDFHGIGIDSECRLQVAELEEQVREVTAQGRQAERAAAEVLAILGSQGFSGHLSDADDDSGSDVQDGEEEEDATTRGDTARAPGDVEAAQGEAEDAMSGTAQLGGLSWKGRSVSPRKARQLKQKHRWRYLYLLSSSDSSPKYRMGQSCRKNKRQTVTRCFHFRTPEPRTFLSILVRYILPGNVLCRSAAVAAGRCHRERRTAATPWPRRVRWPGSTMGRIVHMTAARMTWTARRAAMSGV